MAQLGKVTFKNINGIERTIDLDALLNSALSEATDYRKARSWIGTQLSGPYMNLPPDIGSDPRGDNSFAKGYNKSMFTPEDQAKLDAYTKIMGSLTSSLNSKFSQLKSQYGSVINNQTALNEMQNFMKQNLANLQTFANTETQNVQQRITSQYSSSDPSTDLGSKTASAPAESKQIADARAFSFTKYKELYPSANYDQWQKDHYSTAPTSQGSVENRPIPTADKGTIAEQNKTGMNYLDWKKAQPVGADTSYQAWLKAPPTGTVVAPGTTASNTLSTSLPNPTDKISAALDVINKSNLDDATKSLFRMVVQNWDPAKEVNMQNVLNEFNSIKTKTIDPYFREQATVLGNDIRNTMMSLDGQRNRELETERANASLNIRQAREGLEKSGMTFTGKGVETLGKDSAYAQTPNSVTATPAQNTFGGMFYEGTVNQQNRLISSSSLARYQDQIQKLGRQAENLFGQQVDQFGLPFSKAGVSQGTLDAEKQQKYADTLSALAGQQNQLNFYQQPVSVNQ